MEKHLSQNAAAYTISRLLCVAGLESGQYSVCGTTAAIGSLRISFSLAERAVQDAFFQGNAVPALVPSADGNVMLPLFGSERFSQWEGSTLRILPDVLTVSFALLTRYEETLTDRRDAYGRFFYGDSLAAKYGFIHLPLVDEYALLLRRELEQHCAHLALAAIPPPRITPTHDVDMLWRFQTLFKTIRSIVGGDIILRKSPIIAAHSLRQVLHSRCRPEQDPLVLACVELMEQSKRLGLRSEFYFMGYDSKDSDYQYDVNGTYVHRLIEQMEQGGCVVGFHGGLGSAVDADVYQTQKSHVDAACGKSTTVGRQHYLLFDAEKSPRIWERNGLREDLSLSFFDREGFRCGTCRPYPLYDLAADCPLTVVERPLLLMDCTVQAYRGLSIPQALESANALLNRVIAVGGEFVLLWHNSSLDRGMEQWYRAFYLAFLQDGVQRLREAEYSRSEAERKTERGNIQL